jgi:hypothetical protein
MHKPDLKPPEQNVHVKVTTIDGHAKGEVFDATNTTLGYITNVPEAEDKAYYFELRREQACEQNERYAVLSVADLKYLADQINNFNTKMRK